MNPVEGPMIPLLRPHEPYAPTQQSPTQAAGEAPFAKLLEAAAARTNQHLLDAQAAGEAFATGRSDDIHGTMLTLSKADIELRVMGNVKNKIVDAFYELWRMQA